MYTLITALHPSPLLIQPSIINNSCPQQAPGTLGQLLLADDVGIVDVEGVVADGSPDSHDLDLHPPLDQRLRAVAKLVPSQAHIGRVQIKPRN